ncbi:glycosyltransferase [Spongisporangium articulatum]|uniref:Glucosyl-3-phosphoglycerate synthase n=1 Tax=Spongisporangium articulatum TaxID=3362603 RepID=A0ABW8AJB9_9ACTN
MSGVENVVDEGVNPGTAPGELPGGLAVVIPAKDEAQRIAATVQAAAGIVAGGVPVSLVVVVDDGSSDDTAALAEAAGAVVVKHPKNKGKAGAMSSGAARVASLDRSQKQPAPRALLFLDADLEGSAAAAAALAEPVLKGELDMSIATIPPQATSGGGRGRVVKLATKGIERETGWTPKQPLSGNRCLTRKAFDAAKPLAPGWGVEVGLTIDLLHDGFRVGEVEADLHHRVTGTSKADQKHRADQYRDVWLALLDRRVRKRESRVVLVTVVAARIARSVLGRG